MNKTDDTQVATKSDIARLEQSTKSDIARLEQSTKADIKELRTEIKFQRVESKKADKSLRHEILKVEGRVENLEEGQKRIETKIDSIADTLDGFVRRVDDLTTDDQVGAHQTRELSLQIDDHEKRITRLESPTHTT